MKSRVALGIEYRGTQFCGFQYQQSGRSVQSELEKALSRVANEEIQIEFAGRTDSGVHATNQVISFDCANTRSNLAWIEGTNTYLPNDIAVHTAQEVDSSFDPRRSCSWRRYIYVFGESRWIPAIGRELATWVSYPLDEERLNFAVQVLVGEHDFTSFRAAQCQSKSPFRLVHSVQVVRDRDLVVMDIVANAFLQKMVRNIAGTLLAISNNKVQDLESVLQARDRKFAGVTAPPDGLYLVQIFYEKFDSLSQLKLPLILGHGLYQVLSGVNRNTKLH